MGAFTVGAETVAAWVLVICAVAWVVANRLVVILTWIDARDLRRLAREADDWDEPSREQVEWDAELDQAIRLAQEDDLAARSWDELEFAASVEADLDDDAGIARWLGGAR